MLSQGDSTPADPANAPNLTLGDRSDEPTAAANEPHSTIEASRDAVSQDYSGNFDGDAPASESVVASRDTGDSAHLVDETCGRGASSDVYDVHPPHAPDRPVPTITVTAFVEFEPSAPSRQIGVIHVLGLLCFEAIVFGVARRIELGPAVFLLGLGCFLLMPWLTARGETRAFYWWTLVLTYIVLAVAACLAPHPASG